MIDTVKFQTNFSINHKKVPGWKSKAYREQGKITGRRFTHTRTGLTVTWYAGNTYVETSLPKLLFGSNGRLITSQRQIEKALALADTIASEITSAPLRPFKRFTRVDLAWQIMGRIDDFILALFQFKYPHIQKPTRIYMSETILWHSRDMSLKVYDKLRELKGWRKRNGDILRIEIKLKGKRLKTDFNVLSLKRLDFDQCYRVLRAAVLKLCPIPLPKIPNKLSIYQLAAKHGWKIDGTPALPFLTRELNRDYRKRINSQVAGAVLSKCGIDLRKQFPPNGPHRVFRRNEISYSMPPSRLADFVLAFNKIRSATSSN